MKNGIYWLGCLLVLTTRVWGWEIRYQGLGQTDRPGAVQLEWTERIYGATPRAFPTDLFRNGELIARVPAGTWKYADNGLPAGQVFYYQFLAVPPEGGLDVGILSAPIEVTTRRPDGDFVLDGAPDNAGFQVVSCGCGRMVVYAALRGTKLYVATWSPGNAGPNDHFLFVSATGPVAPWVSQPAPWAKDGYTHFYPGTPFLGGESTNGFVGWFNAPATSRAFKSATNAGMMEGVIDLLETYGTIPPVIHVAAYAFATADGGQSANSPTNATRLDTIWLTDHNANGRFDRTDPADGFRTTITRLPGGDLEFRYPAREGGLYYLDMLTPQGQFRNRWTQSIPGVGATENVFVLPASSAPDAALFFRVRTY